MVSVDSLTTVFRLEDDYTTPAQRATAATNQFAQAVTKATAAQKAAQASFGKGGSFGQGGGSFGNPGTSRSNAFANKAGPSVAVKKIAGTNPFEKAAKGASDFFDGVRDKTKEIADGFKTVGAVAAGIFAIGGTLAVGGAGLMRQAAEFDSLRQSLIAVEGSSKAAKRELSDLKKLARAPGLGFEEAVQSYTGLRNAGLDERFSEELIKQFANANARGGGNVETFGRIMAQVRQAATRPFLSQEDLVPIGEAGVPINKVLKDRFGTGDTEELKKRGIGAEAALHGIVEELSKLQRVAGGERNEFDNLGDAWKFAGVAAGEGLNQGLLPYVSAFAAAVGNLTEGGEIEEAFKTAAETLKDILGGADDEDGMENLLRGILVATEDTATFTRNLALNSKGFGDWVSDNVRHSLLGRALGWDKEGNGQDLSAVGEHDRNVKDVQANKEFGVKRRYQEAIDRGAYGPGVNYNGGRKGYVSHPGAYKEFAANYKDDEYQRYLEAVENGEAQPGTWAQWKAAHKDAKAALGGKDVSTATLKRYNQARANKEIPADMSLADFAKKEAEDKAKGAQSNPAIPLLQRIAVASERHLDLATQLQGGSTQVADVTSDYGMKRTMRGRGHTEMDRAVRHLMDVLGGFAEAGGASDQRRGWE